MLVDTQGEGKGHCRPSKVDVVMDDVVIKGFRLASFLVGPRNHSIRDPTQSTFIHSWPNDITN